MARLIAASNGGVSFTEAMSMSERERRIWEFAIGIQRGGNPDWDRAMWDEPMAPDLD